MVQRRLQFLERHHLLVRPQALRALVGDGLLEVGEDLGPVRVAREARARLGEPGLEARIGVLLELVGVAVEAGGDDAFHEVVPCQRPMAAMVWLMRVQYSSSTASCASPAAVSR